MNCPRMRVLGAIFLSCVVLFAVSSWINRKDEVQYIVKECNCPDKKPAPSQVVETVAKPSTTTTRIQSTKKTWAEIALEYHTYVNTVQIKCNNIVRLGHAGDGGWDICDDDKYGPKKPCLVYSFGINDDWSFDDVVSKNYGCHVHAFDPSLPQNDYDRSPLIHFHKLGLAEKEYKNSQGWRLNTLAGIRKQLGHSETAIHIIKMDTDKYELTSLPEMVSSGALKDVTQFVFEIHIRISNRSEPEADIAKYEMGLRILKQVYDEGFRIFKTHQNPWSKYISRFGPVRYGCHELHMPVLHDWCNKGRGMCYTVCGIVHKKEPLLLFGNSSPCSGSGFPLSLSEWYFTICPTPCNRK